MLWLTATYWTLPLWRHDYTYFYAVFVLAVIGQIGLWVMQVFLFLFFYSVLIFSNGGEIDHHRPRPRRPQGHNDVLLLGGPFDPLLRLLYPLPRDPRLLVPDLLVCIFGLCLNISI